MLKSRIKEAKRELDRTLRRNLRRAGKIWREEAQEMLSHPGMGTPSSPGAPPHMQRGVLKDSLVDKVSRDDNGQLGSELGSTQWWARLPEKGTVKMEPRPYVVPAMRRKRQEIHEALSEPMN